MASLQTSIEDIVHSAPGTYSVLVECGGAQRLVRINPDEEYEMASTVKVSIVLCLLEMLRNGELHWYEPLTLKQSHKRGGTGILRRFSPGFTLTLSQTVELMLQESDNTAANVLLERMQGQRTVNEHLRAVGIEHTGLTDRSDCLFESGIASAADMMAVWGRLMWVTTLTYGFPMTSAALQAISALYKSHYLQGLRRFEGTKYNLRPLELRASLFGLLGMRSSQQQLLMRVLADRPLSQIGSREGILPNYQGVSYLHELATFDYHQPFHLLVAVFCCGTAEEGYTLDKAGAVLGKIGQAVQSYLYR